MYFGGSIALIVIGAILAFAVTYDMPNVNIPVVGYICIAAGALGIILSLITRGQRDGTPRA